MKAVTCGVIFINNNKILLGHSTGNSHWDIPKGMMEDHESYIEAAIRETFEETGIAISEQDLIYLGKYSYNVHKDIALYCTNKIVNPADFVCTSFFKAKNGQHMPEIDALEYIDFSYAMDYSLSRSMKNVLSNLKDKLFV